MSAHIQEKPIHCSIRETHSSSLSSTHSRQYQKKTQDFARTYSKVSRQNAPSLHDAVVDQDSDIDDIEIDTLTETCSVDIDTYGDEIDSAYCSLESDNGNLPQLDLLVEPDLLVIGHGINVDILPCIKQTTRDTRYLKGSRRDKSLENPVNESSKDAVNTSAHWSKSLNVDEVDSDIINACERYVETETRLQDEVSGEKSFVTPDNTCSTSSANASAEKSNESDDEKLWRSFLTESVDDYTYIATPIGHDAEYIEKQGHALTEHQSDYIDSQFELENFDSNVGKAFKASLQSQSISPLIKEELKCLIQCRRLQDGKPEIFIEPEEPKEYRLTEEEVKKKNTRLEQNRKSARKARQRMRGNHNVLTKYIDDAEKAQAKLSQEASQLRQERDKIRDTLGRHLEVCGKHRLAGLHRRILKYVNLI